MNSIINTVVAFVLIAFFVIIFLGLLTIVANILFFGVIIGGALYIILWIANKLFPNAYKNKFNKFAHQSRAKQNKQQSNNYNYNVKYNQAAEERFSGFDSANQHNQYNQHKQHKKGRIIDVEPEPDN